MDNASKLKVIAKHGVGYDNIDVEYATKKNIQVVYAPLGNVNSVAEHALLMIMNCARRTNYVQKEFKGGNYDMRYSLKHTHDLAKHTVGICGCGRIGQMLAKKAHYGLEMEVIGYDPYASQEKLDAAEIPIHLVSSKEELFTKADFVSLHLPSTPETKHSIGKNEFRLMKKSAYIINTSRGDIICEQELLEALKSGEIMGAGLDVYENEPVSGDYELLHMDNVFTTPHVAGMTEEASERLSYSGAQGIVEALYHKPLTFPVNHIKVCDGI